jgi:hypothetical protein
VASPLGGLLKNYSTERPIFLKNFPGSFSNFKMAKFSYAKNITHKIQALSILPTTVPSLLLFEICHPCHGGLP